MESTTASGRYVRFGSDESESSDQTRESVAGATGRKARADAGRTKSRWSEPAPGWEPMSRVPSQSTFYEDTGALDRAAIVSENDAGPDAAVVSSADLSQRAASTKREVGTRSSAETLAPSSSWLGWRGWVGSVTGFFGKTQRHSVDSGSRLSPKGLEPAQAAPGDRERARSDSAFGSSWQPERSASYMSARPIPTGAPTTQVSEQRGRKGVLEFGRSFLNKFTYPLRKPSTDSSRRNLLLEFGTAETDQAGFQVITRTRERTPGRSQSPQQRVEFLIKNLDTGEERYLTESEVAQMTSAEIVHQLVRRHRTVAQSGESSQDDGAPIRSSTMSRRPSTSFSATPLSRFRSVPLLSRSKNLQAQAASAGSSNRSATAPASSLAAGSAERNSPHTITTAAAWDDAADATSSTGRVQASTASTDGFRTPAGSLDEGVLVTMPTADQLSGLDAGSSNAASGREAGAAVLPEGPRYHLRFPSKGVALNKREHQRLLRDFRVAQLFVRVQAPNKARGAQIIPNMCLVQCFRPHLGPVWSMEFSADGKYLATGGQDAVIMVWNVQNEPHTLNYGNADLAEVASWLRSAATAGTSTFQPFLVPPHLKAGTGLVMSDDDPNRLYTRRLFRVEEPHRVFRGHGGDVLCVAWSANNFLLSSSMDKTVRLWHVDYGQVLRKFLHADFVTCVTFHPRNENFFLSGSLDERIRLWNISSRHVSDYAEVRGLVTACGFTPNGEQALVGTYRGECKVYNVVRFEEGERALQYITTLEVHSRRGRNRKGSKITSFAMMPAPERISNPRTLMPVRPSVPLAASVAGQTHKPQSDVKQTDPKSTAQQYEVLISTNDSRIRLYRVQDLRIVSKYVGHSCTWNHIRAGFSDDFRYVITASEDRLVYIWDTVLYEHTERNAGERSWQQGRALLGHWLSGRSVEASSTATSSVDATRPLAAGNRQDWQTTTRNTDQQPRTISLALNEPPNLRSDQAQETLASGSSANSHVRVWHQHERSTAYPSLPQRALRSVHAVY
ncbi:WD repeat-containing protein 44 [Cyanidiococcus yangmingshanensis]|uniref:WD repeat-containing protein 44 n=1 Tax=Cyanidiococcus yangmingshanensis TaxID=2690220 RepID=A0A7J7ICK7_9RHOD|nr:WD repeat-containing protein 44 [Cyanidiococcus yangmingshanensis]